MPYSEVGICNMALSGIGVNATITALSAAGTMEQRGCNLWYAHCRDELLESFPWTFATRTAILALVDDAEPGGWTYAYRYPANCAQVLVVTDENGTRTPIRQPTFGQAMLNLRSLPNPIPWQLHGDTDGRLILTDLEDAYVWYVYAETDPVRYNAHFANLLAARLAPELAMFLKCAPAVVADARQKYAIAQSQARVQVLNEQQPDPANESPSIQVRGG